VEQLSFCKFKSGYSNIVGGCKTAMTAMFREDEVSGITKEVTTGFAMSGS
jgi:hypothetical protein